MTVFADGKTGLPLAYYQWRSHRGRDHYRV